MAFLRWNVILLPSNPSRSDGPGLVGLSGILLGPAKHLDQQRDIYAVESVLCASTLLTQ